MSRHKFLIQDETGSKELAARIARNLRGNELVTLSGGLGTGKTTFARALINSISKKKQDVISPTFNIVQIYDTKLGKLWHYDLYRIKSVGEMAELGIDDAIASGTVIVEWPELAGDVLSSAQLKINFSYPASGSGRIVEIDCDKKWDALLKKYDRT